MSPLRDELVLSTLHRVNYTPLSFFAHLKVLWEQKFQSEIMLMPHPPVSAVTPPGICVEGALFCFQNMLELNLLLGWSFEFGDFGTPSSPVACWAPTMCQALCLLHVHT